MGLGSFEQCLMSISVDKKGKESVWRNNMAPVKLLSAGTN